MAEGYQDNPMGIETFSPTLLSGFSIESWGWIHAWRIGSIGIVSVHGMKSNSSISQDTSCMQVPYKIAGDVTNFGKCGSSQLMNALIVVESGNTYIKVNNVLSLTPCYFTLVFPIVE